MIATVLLLLLAVEDPKALMKGASSRLSAEAPPRPADERYRIAGDADTGASAAQRALAVDGGQCNVVGARLCTKKPRTLLSRPLGN